MEIGIEEGALTGAPVWEPHARGKNWLATIAADPTAPSGLARDFHEKARGNHYYYMATSLKAGAAVEFGADYYTASGRKHSKRWYGVVVAIKDGSMTLEECATARRAITRARELREAMAAAEYARSGADVRRAELAAELASLRARALELERELETLGAPPNLEFDFTATETNDRREGASA